MPFPVQSLTEIIKSGGFHPTVERRLETAEKISTNRPAITATSSPQPPAFPPSTYPWASPAETLYPPA
jgi:hypothetical protein